MKTPEETAIEILEWLNFDHTRCTDWVEAIAEIIAKNVEIDVRTITVAGLTIPEIVAMKAAQSSKGL